MSYSWRVTGITTINWIRSVVIYGEEVEKYREIKLDLVEVKEMYKVQLEDLVKQINSLTSV